MKIKHLLFYIAFVPWFMNPALCQPNGYGISGSNFESSVIEPTKIIKVGDSHYFIDFGKDAFGTLMFFAKAQLSDTLIIHLGEKTINSTQIDTNPGGTIRYQKIKLTDIPLNKNYSVQLQPDKRNTNPPAIALPDSFGVIMPFRYCELENLTIPINDLKISQKVYNYHFNNESSYFECDDTLLTKVWEMCKYTIKATSFAGLYIDGDRERIPYEADAYINQMSHFCVDNDYSMAMRTNEYFIHNPTWPTEWILHTVLLFYNYYMYSGNTDPLVKNYDALKYKTLIDLEREDGLISSKSDKLTDKLMTKLGFRNPTQRLHDIVDWPPAQSETSWHLATPEGERDGYEMVDINTVVNSFHYMNLKLMSEIAGYLGKKDDSTMFFERSIKVKDAINQKLFNKNTGIYVDGENSRHSSLHANMFPLAFGIVPDANRKAVIDFIKTRGMACSVYGAQYLLEGLYRYNEPEYAFDLMTSTSDRSWWNMMHVGSTMTMEAWDMKYKPNLDWNHAWGSAPANIITRYMWGIQPVQPGFGKVKIKPQLGNLKYSKIKVPTTKGAIISTYKVKNNRRKIYTIELPLSMYGNFVLDMDNYSNIVLNKKRIKSNNRIISVQPGINKIRLKL